MAYLLDVIEQEPTLRTFLLGAKLSELVDAYLSSKSAGPYTLFIPNDATFNQQWTPQAALDLLQKPEQLASILKRHIAEGSLTLEAMQEKGLFKNCDNSDLKFDAEQKTVNQAHVLKTIVCDNGVIHIIDRVLES